MACSNAIFHLAFPVHDLEAAKHFYHELLGFQIGRVSEHALILKFGEHQIVAHKVSDSLPVQEQIYPRHFGLIFLDAQEFEQFIDLIKKQNIPFAVPPKVRFPQSKIEHRSFFIKDPSNNWLEFKFYTYSSAIFGENHYGQIGDA